MTRVTSSNTVKKIEIIEVFLVLSESLFSQDPMKKEKPHAYFHGERLNIKNIYIYNRE